MGFFGGFLHCTSMCSPFVIHQVSSKLATKSPDSFYGAKKFLSLGLFPYHLGRICTYATIGYFCSALSSKVVNNENFNYVTGSLLVTSALIVLIAITPKQWRLSKIFNVTTLSFIKILRCMPFATFFTRSFQALYINTGLFKGFLLGVILGFLPCGLLYSAFAIAFSINEPIFAAFGMLIFGFATFPALFLVGLTGYGFFTYSKFNIKLIARLVILINCVTIFIIGINLLIK